MQDLSPYEIKERLKQQFNCKIKQVPRGYHDFLNIEVKEKLGVLMLFGLIPFVEYKISKKKLYFNASYTLSSKYYHLNRREESNIDTALDLDNNILYWKYSSI